MARRDVEREDEDFGLELRAPHEEITEQVKRAEQQLVDLQRKAEQLEAQKRELEDMAARQQEVRIGRREMQEKLRRAVVILSREEESARREAQMLEQTRGVFSEALATVETIDPDNPEPGDVAAALTEDLSRIDHARTVFNQHRARLAILQGEEGNRAFVAPAGGEEVEVVDAGGSPGFGELVLRGFAHNLPVLILGLVWLAVWLVK